MPFRSGRWGVMTGVPTGPVVPRSPFRTALPPVASVAVWIAVVCAAPTRRSDDARSRRMRLAAAPFAAMALAASLLLMGCDTAESSRFGTVTSRSDTVLCFEPEDRDQTPECFDTTVVSIPDTAQPGACVRTVATLDNKLLRVETLDRACRPRK